LDSLLEFVLPQLGRGRNSDRFRKFLELGGIPVPIVELGQCHRSRELRVRFQNGSPVRTCLRTNWFVSVGLVEKFIRLPNVLTMSRAFFASSASLCWAVFSDIEGESTTSSRYHCEAW